MVERFAIVVLIGLALLVVWRVFLLWQQWRLRRTQRTPLPPRLLELIRPGAPAVLAFSTPGCVECRMLQAPALRKLEAQLADQISIAHLPVPDYPELASHYGILSAPATVVLDAAGTVRHINQRYTDAERLREQIEETSSLPLAA